MSQPSLPPLPPNPFHVMHGMIENGRQKVRDVSDGMRSLAGGLQGLKTGNFPTPNTIASPAPPAPARSYGVSNAETLLYQLQHLRDPLRQIELHLSEGCRILGKACDCCAKSGNDIRMFAEETIPIAARQGVNPAIFIELAAWGAEMQAVGIPPVVEKGEFDYHAESGTASTYRKRVEQLIEEVKAKAAPKAGCNTCQEKRQELARLMKQAEEK